MAYLLPLRDCLFACWPACLLLCCPFVGVMSTGGGVVGGVSLSPVSARGREPPAPWTLPFWRWFEEEEESTQGNSKLITNCKQLFYADCSTCRLLCCFLAVSIDPPPSPPPPPSCARRQANEAIELLREKVDTLIVIANDKLLQVK